MRSEEEELDEEFPMGAGVADTSVKVRCPHCGETVEMALDPGSGAEQDYVEDCEVCCRPWQVTVTYDDEGGADVSVIALEE